MLIVSVMKMIIMSMKMKKTVMKMIMIMIYHENGTAAATDAAVDDDDNDDDPVMTCIVTIFYLRFAQGRDCLILLQTLHRLMDLRKKRVDHRVQLQQLA